MSSGLCLRHIYIYIHTTWHVLVVVSASSRKALRLVWRFGSCVSTGWIVNM